jgi:hypothetical protein
MTTTKKKHNKKLLTRLQLLHLLCLLPLAFYICINTVQLAIGVVTPTASAGETAGDSGGVMRLVVPPSASNWNRSPRGPNKTTTTQKASRAATAIALDDACKEEEYYDDNSPTRVTMLTAATDLYEHVCMNYTLGQKRHTLQVFTDDKEHARQLETMREKISETVWDRHHWLTTKVYPLKDWHNMLKLSRRSTIDLVREKTVFTNYLYGNTAHCLTDLVFTLGLDYYVGTINQTCTTEQQQQQGPFYPKYIQATWKKFAEEIRIPRKHWCNEFLHTMGWIDQYKGFIDVTSHHPICFKKMVVPAVELFRMPYSLVERKIRKKQSPAGKNVELPTAALEQMRARMLQHLHLPSDPWPTAANATSIHKTILLHVRADAERRKMTNHVALQQLLQQNYQNVTVTILKEDWIGKNFSQQAQTYNQYQYVVTGHGAHLANAFYCRANTQIVEFFCCFGKNPIPINVSLTHAQMQFLPPEAKMSHAWDGGSQRSWFSTWARRMGMDYYEVGQTSCQYNHEDIKVNLTQAIPLIANRFGLVPRHRQSS